LRTNGRTGARSRAPAPLDDRAAREAVEQARAERLARHREHLREILSAPPGQALSHGAARVALATLMDAVRQTPRGDRRRAVREGLACTVVWTGTETATIRSPTWRVSLPGRLIVFHQPESHPRLGAVAHDPGGRVAVHVEEVVA
jgi:hypothetical protein